MFLVLFRSSPHKDWTAYTETCVSIGEARDKITRSIKDDYSDPLDVPGPFEYMIVEATPVEKAVTTPPSPPTPMVEFVSATLTLADNL